MRRVTALHLLLVAAAGCYDTRLLDGRPAPNDPRDAAFAGNDAAFAGEDAGSACGPDGTICAPTSDPCQLPGRCLHGLCTPITDAPDGTAYDPAQPLARCCQGKPSRIDSPDNCGACGISCNGHDCLNVHGGHYYCGCWVHADCWSGCCSAAYGAPWVCAAQSCETGQPLACPGNAINTDGHPDGPSYCHY
jgi:hypothetical protein